MKQYMTCKRRKAKKEKKKEKKNTSDSSDASVKRSNSSEKIKFRKKEQIQEFKTKIIDNITKNSNKTFERVVKFIKKCTDKEILKLSNAIMDVGTKIKKKRRRTVVTHFQHKHLSNTFKCNAFPETDAREEMARSLGMSSRSVQIWFQNQRQRTKSLLSKMDLSGLDLLAEAASKMTPPGSPKRKISKDLDNGDTQD